MEDVCVVIFWQMLSFLIKTLYMICLEYGLESLDYGLRIAQLLFLTLRMSHPIVKAIVQKIVHYSVLP